MIDRDIDDLDRSMQSYQELVKLWVKKAQDSLFIVDTSINPLDWFDISSFNTGDKMYLQVIPYDGLNYGASLSSDVYEITEI